MNWSIDNTLTVIEIVVATLGVGATITFSSLLWLATERSTRAAEQSAAAAEASTRIAESLEKRRAEMSRLMRMQLLQDLKRQTWDIISLLSEISLKELAITDGFKDKTRKPLITSYDLAEHFTENDRAIINRAWNHYEAYINNYWEKQTDDSFKYTGQPNQRFFKDIHTQVIEAFLEVDKM